jgi:hypothetical protein
MQPMIRWFLLAASFANAFCAGVALERGLMLDMTTFILSAIVWGFGAFVAFVSDL